MHLFRHGLAEIAVHFVLLLFATISSAHPLQKNDQPGNSCCGRIVRSELDFLARIPNRRTGSKHHNELIDHIEHDLSGLGLKVQSDTWHFDFNEAPTTPPKLAIGHKSIHVSSTVPYSGNTKPGGVTGPLINLISPNIVPDWEKASGGIAVLNITNAPQNRTVAVPLWPGSPAWEDPYVQVAASTANVVVVNLTDAAAAGVKGIVYVWDNISTGLAKGQYGPFWTDFQGIPALYVSPEAGVDVIKAASKKKKATITITGKLTRNTPTRNIWTIIPGTERPHESVIINTHTDGVNIGEENGHIALLAYARSLVRRPPKRTTILAFITAHIHSAPFSYSTHRSTTLWLADHPSLWNGSSPDRLTAVFGSCVEHLGMLDFIEDLEANTYTLSDKPADEVLFAATQELANLTFKEWIGAVPNLTRVINPLTTDVPNQGGEGLPFLLNGIPEISLVTAPGWLLKQFPKGTDQLKFIDVPAVQRQVDSFERIWRKVDRTSAKKLGSVGVPRFSG